MFFFGTQCILGSRGFNSTQLTLSLLASIMTSVAGAGTATVVLPPTLRPPAAPPPDEDGDDGRWRAVPAGPLPGESRTSSPPCFCHNIPHNLTGYIRPTSRQAAGCLVSASSELQQYTTSSAVYH